jgi:hypothetical protein
LDEQDDDRRARAPEPDDVVRICRALNDAGARYLLIGGFAVIAHGAGRFTKDIDFLVDDAPANVARVKVALSVLADNAASEVADDDVQRHVVVRVADEVVVDLMGRACGLPSPATLIRLKDTARPQDAIDRAFLEGVLREREAPRRPR